MENVEIWKIKISHIPTFPTALLPQGNGDFKKNSFFYFYGGRETRDGGRKTEDAKRKTGDERTHTPSQQQETGNKHTQNIAQKRQDKCEQNDIFVQLREGRAREGGLF